MGFLHVQNPHLEQTASAGLQEGPVLLTCPAHSVSEARAPLQILHLQNVRLAQRAPGEHWALPGK